MEKMILSAVVMSSLAAFLGIVLSFAYSKLKVEEDPKIKEIIELLPGANCGACGFASCEDFAQRLANKEVTIDKCKITLRNKEKVQVINSIING